MKRLVGDRHWADPIRALRADDGEHLCRHVCDLGRTTAMSPPCIGHEAQNGTSTHRIRVRRGLNEAERGDEEVEIVLSFGVFEPGPVAEVGQPGPDVGVEEHGAFVDHSPMVTPRTVGPGIVDEITPDGTVSDLRSRAIWSKLQVGEHPTANERLSKWNRVTPGVLQGHDQRPKPTPATYSGLS
jgi:hypothetical protein